MTHILIIGGGFGGVYAAKQLLHHFKHVKDIAITLISKTNYFLFIPMLHEVATGGLCGHDLTEPFREIISSKNFHFLKDTILSIDLNKKTVKTATTNLAYDYLVLATGSTTNFYNVPGAEQHALTLKSLEDAHTIKRHLIESVEQAFKKPDTEERKKYTSVAIIGAGATGIELSIEIKELMDQLLKNNPNNSDTPTITLIQRGDAILPQFPELRKDVEKALINHHITLLLNSPVSEITDHEVRIASGTTIHANTIIWTAGITPNTIPTTPPVTNKQGYLEVNQFLQLTKYPTVFAIGDCASYIPPGKTLPMPALAQVASEEGKHAAKNIINLITNKSLQPFIYDLRGILLSLGRRKGAAVIKGIKIKGFIAWWLMRTIYLFKILGTVNKLKTAYDWTLNLFAKRDTTEY